MQLHLGKVCVLLTPPSSQAAHVEQAGPEAGLPSLPLGAQCMPMQLRAAGRKCAAPRSKAAEPDCLSTGSALAPPMCHDVPVRHSSTHHHTHHSGPSLSISDAQEQ